MRIEQRQWRSDDGWTQVGDGALDGGADLVLVFGAVEVLGAAGRAEEVRERYPDARVVFCSTAGEIAGTSVRDDSLVTTAIGFDATRVAVAHTEAAAGEDSGQLGRRLGEQLEHANLSHVLVFSDGLHVNGTELARGLSGALPEGVAVTGGLAGDGDRFGRTLVGLDTAPAPLQVVAVGLYGDRLRVGYGSLGGWDSFGPERKITRAEGNVLYELDGTSALQLYKRYLGEYAEQLPASGLRFPLSLRTDDGRDGIVRTVLGVDEEAQSMTFAGDMPVGAYARLMRANFDRLIDGASGAARASIEPLAAASVPTELALLISCVGRKMVLRQRTEEELESVREVVGEQAVLAGFYSYGEISPVAPQAACDLHNQTMTITTLAEAPQV